MWPSNSSNNNTIGAKVKQKFFKSDNWYNIKIRFLSKRVDKLETSIARKYVLCWIQLIKRVQKRQEKRAHSVHIQKGNKLYTNQMYKIRSTADEMFFSSTLKMFAQILGMMSFAQSEETKMVCMEWAARPNLQISMGGQVLNAERRKERERNKFRQAIEFWGYSFTYRKKRLKACKSEDFCLSNRSIVKVQTCRNSTKLL